MTDCYIIEKLWHPNIQCCMSCLEDLEYGMHIHEPSMDLISNGIKYKITLSLCCNHAKYVKGLAKKSWKKLLKEHLHYKPEIIDDL